MQTSVRTAPYSDLPENTNPCVPAAWVCFLSDAVLFTKALGGPGPSQAGRPTRAPLGTLVYIQTQIIIRDHFKKPWVRTCSRILFECCCFFFFWPEHISPIYFWNLLDPPLTTFCTAVFAILEASLVVVWRVSYSEAWRLPCLSRGRSFSVMCFLFLSFSKK